MEPLLGILGTKKESSFTLEGTASAAGTTRACNPSDIDIFNENDAHKKVANNNPSIFINASNSYS